MDGALISVPFTSEAVDLLTWTKDVLMSVGKIQLHKFASNSGEVMAKLPLEGLSKELTNLDLNTDDLPMHQTLGLIWDLETDSFTF